MMQLVQSLALYIVVTIFGFIAIMTIQLGSESIKKLRLISHQSC